MIAPFSRRIARSQQESAHSASWVITRMAVSYTHLSAYYGRTNRITPIACSFDVLHSTLWPYPCHSFSTHLPLPFRDSHKTDAYASNDSRDGGKRAGCSHLSLIHISPATFLFFILPQFRERGNRQFFWRISYLLDIRDERSFRCRLRVVHRWTAP